jgi:hypothetical protein
MCHSHDYFLSFIKCVFEQLELVGYALNFVFKVCVVAAQLVAALKASISETRVLTLSIEELVVEGYHAVKVFFLDFNYVKEA